MIHGIGSEIDRLVGEIRGFIVFSKWIQFGLVYCKVVDKNNRNDDSRSRSVANGDLLVDSAPDHWSKTKV